MEKKEQKTLQDFLNKFTKVLLEKQLLLYEPIYYDYHFIAKVTEKNSKSNNFILIKIYYKPTKNSFKLIIMNNAEFESILIECFNKITVKSDKFNYSNEINIYIDGSYNEKTDKTGWAYCIVKDYKIIHKARGTCSLLTNETRQVLGEVYSLYKAIEYMQINKIIKANIFYDYMGIEAWIKGRWKIKEKNLIEIVDKIKKMIEDSSIQIDFIKVDAHQGNYFNELVDKLAKESTE